MAGGLPVAVRTADGHLQRTVAAVGQGERFGSGGNLRIDVFRFGVCLCIAGAEGAEVGVGKVYPFMRSHKILDNIQHIFADIPVLMLYPGTFNGQDLGLFGKFLDGHYYRAFNLL